MANTLFDPGREGFLLGEIAWVTATVKAHLTRGYTFTASHKFLTDATGAGATLVATVTLAGRSGANGHANATSPTTFPTVTTGAACTSILLVQTSAPAGGADLATSAQRLIGYIDNALILPVSPNGGNIDVGWATGTDKIFTL
jgi:hypothetical protein